MGDSAQKNTTADFLAWGRYYEELLTTPRPPGVGITWTQPMLNHYIAAANEALRQQCERESKQSRKKPGRPTGGMGEMKRRLLAVDVPEEVADRISAKAYGSTVEGARRAYDTLIRKKPPG
jgi:hypothetical protein